MAILLVLALLDIPALAATAKPLGLVVQAREALLDNSTLAVGTTVYPGDTVEYHMTKTARRKNMWWYRGKAKVGGKTVAEAEVGAVINTL